MASSKFREEQGFRQWWIWLILGLVVAVQWWGFIQQIVLGQPWGNKPAPDWLMVLLWLIFGIGLPAFFLYLRLIITVTETAVEIRYRPLTRRTIPISEISKVEVRTYSPMREYAGWGVRGWGGRIAYSVSGNRGVELTLIDDQIVMIGSRRADELAGAIVAAQGGELSGKQEGRETLLNNQSKQDPGQSSGNQK